MRLVVLASKTITFSSRFAVRCASYILLDEFLVCAEVRSLMDFVWSHESDFRPSEVVSAEQRSKSDLTHRRSMVLLSTGPFQKLIADRIKFYFPYILKGLQHTSFEIQEIETQITASNDGDFFRVHNDSKAAYLPSREITYVYFCHRAPKMFEGGELNIYDPRLQNGSSQVAVRSPATIIPRQNQIIFFPSAFPHEVLAVRCPSHAFADSRFTLNGWIHRRWSLSEGSDPAAENWTI